MYSHWHPVKTRISFKEGAVAISDGFQYQRQFSLKDAVSPTGSPYCQPSANVAIDPQFQATILFNEFGQHLIPHQPGVEFGNLLRIVFTAYRQEQVTGHIGMSQCIAPGKVGIPAFIPDGIDHM